MNSVIALTKMSCSLQSLMSVIFKSKLIKSTLSLVQLICNGRFIAGRICLIDTRWFFSVEIPININSQSVDNFEKFVDVYWLRFDLRTYEYVILAHILSVEDPLELKWALIYVRNDLLHLREKLYLVLAGYDALDLSVYGFDFVQALLKLEQWPYFIQYPRSLFLILLGVR